MVSIASLQTLLSCFPRFVFCGKAVHFADLRVGERQGRRHGGAGRHDVEAWATSDYSNFTWF
jgi:hypothetical protein